MPPDMISGPKEIVWGRALWWQGARPLFGDELVIKVCM